MTWPRAASCSILRMVSLYLFLRAFRGPKSVAFRQVTSSSRPSHRRSCSRSVPGQPYAPCLTLMSRSFQLLRPEFSWLVGEDDKTKIFDLIGRLIQTLSSPEVAIDNKHTPKLHAKFLAGLLTKHHQDSNQSQFSQTPLPPSKQPAGGNPASYEGQPQPSSTSTQYLSHGPGTTQSTSMQQGGFDNVSYVSDPNLSSQPNISFAHHTTQYQLQTSDGVAAAQDSVVSAMAGLSEEEMLATLRAIGNPNWWSNVMMPGYANLLSIVVWCLITYGKTDSLGRVRPLPALRKAPGRSPFSPSLRAPLCQALLGSVQGSTCIPPLKPPPFHFTRTTLFPSSHLGHFYLLFHVIKC